MEVRVKDVIINVDRQDVSEHDKSFLEQQANFLVGYFHSNEQLKKIAYIMFADVGVTLAKIALLQSIEGNGKDGR